MLLASNFSTIAIDVGLALIALVVGFGAALLYVRHTTGASAGEGDDGPTDAEQEAAANEAQRASMAADQVRDLTNSVASDVGEHNQLVNDISAELGSVNASGKESGVMVAEAIAKLLDANERLQGRLEEAEQKIRSQAEELRVHESEARTDALTQLANRRAFDDALNEALRRFQSDRQPLSMILLDVDHFKEFNDTYGHQAGDEVLRSVGRTLQRVVKKTDSPCRYGGEEFAVVMPNTNTAQGRIAAERVRKAVESMEVQFEDKLLKVTASIGLAEIGSGEQSAQLIRRADDAVYAAKKAGRNNGHWHDGVECLPVSEESRQVDQTETPPEDAKTAASAEVEDAPLPDRSSFASELSRRVAESHRFGVSLSVMHLRVKDYADLAHTYGDAVGELILDSVAGFIRSTLREMDLLASLDSGEFGVMLPGSSENEAKLVGKRIQTAISNCVIPLGKTKLRLEIDLGVATVEPDDDAAELMSRAEYLMQRSGAATIEA